MISKEEAQLDEYLVAELLEIERNLHRLMMVSTGETRNALERASRVVNDIITALGR